ncbi:MAG: FAD-dependent oxidoreductase [Clostridiales Family XIII bacterium]|jgi:NADPH-dependent glutamate synthase beta subunit-like oxidoreductase/ferredoxin|nr:FAD-dependent oxidoreductase [Clostridiales Family XIII bacterium]
MKATVNGTFIESAPGVSILDAALSAGIYIPHLCAHPDLEPQGGCKLCTVEVRRAGGGGPELRTACNTELEDGMEIATRSAAIDELRTMSIELLLADHPKECTGCRMYLKCEFQALMQYLSATGVRMREIRRRMIGVNADNPLIDREMERCICCGRCIRICKDVRGIGALRYNHSEQETYVGTEGDAPLKETDCRFCGACVEVCPTGALQDRLGIFRDDLPRREALVPCKAECPVHTDIPRYLRYAREGRYSDAVAVIREKIPLPGVLGHVCTAYCEKRCKRSGLDEALAVRNTKRLAVERDTERAWKARERVRPDTGRRVAVVGAGPCGLTAAYYLRKQGHAVTVYEREARPGGMLAYGIPPYRLPAALLEDEITDMLACGIELKTGAEVANAAGLREEGFDAVLVAVGAAQGKRLPIPGADLPGTLTALEFLHAAAEPGGAAAIPGTEPGTKVCVLGGGNVAFDAARTAARRGADVTLLCLEARGEMLADKEEIEDGAAEGVRILPSKTFLAVAEKDGRASGVSVQGIRRFSFGAEGLAVEAIPGTEETLPADVVIFAAGQKCALKEDFGIALNRAGYPDTADDGQTSAPGVFAAGDAVTGTKAVIDAVAEGRKAAEAIDRFLGGDGDITETLVDKEDFPGEIGVLPGFAALKRTEEITECDRCLLCDLRTGIRPVLFCNHYSA